jgi:hypothetical protein
MWITVSLTLLISNFITSHCYYHYQYPYDGPLRKACRTPPDYTYIESLLGDLGLERKHGGDSLSRYYREFFGVDSSSVSPGVRVHMVNGQPIIYAQVRQAGGVEGLVDGGGVVCVCVCVYVCVYVCVGSEE